MKKGVSNHIIYAYIRSKNQLKFICKIEKKKTEMLSESGWA